MDNGQQAPDFELRDQHGQQVRLSAFRGHSAVAVMFYPYAFSGLCTRELADVEAALPDLRHERTELLAVSCDPVYSLRVFADQEGLSFPLLSDFWPHGAVAASYRALDRERGCAGRSTFLVDPAGLIRWSLHHAMADPRDPADLVRAARELRSGPPSEPAAR